MHWRTVTSPARTDAFAQGIVKLPSTGKRSKLFTTAIRINRWPLITMNRSMAMCPKNRATALIWALEDGSKKDAKFSPICKPMISPANSTAANTSRTEKPIASPTATCWATAPNASRPLTLITGWSPRTPCAQSATRNAKPILRRIGMVRMEKIGATENTASTRKNGQRMGDSQAMSWASENVITSSSQVRGIQTEGTSGCKNPLLPSHGASRSSKGWIRWSCG